MCGQMRYRDSGLCDAKSTSSDIDKWFQVQGRITGFGRDPDELTSIKIDWGRGRPAMYHRARLLSDDGGDGTVWLFKAESGYVKEVAVKIPNKTGGLRREIEIIDKIPKNFRCVIPAIHVTRRNAAFIVMPRMKSDFRVLLSKRHGLSTEVALSLCLQIAKSAQRLLERGIYLLDIKPGNLLYVCNANRTVMMIADHGSMTTKEAIGLTYPPLDINTGKKIYHVGRSRVTESMVTWGIGLLYISMCSREWEHKDDVPFMHDAASRDIKAIRALLDAHSSHIPLARIMGRGTTIKETIASFQSALAKLRSREGKRVVRRSRRPRQETTRLLLPVPQPHPGERKWQDGPAKRYRVYGSQYVLAETDAMIKIAMGGLIEMEKGIRPLSYRVGITVKGQNYRDPPRPLRRMGAAFDAIESGRKLKPSSVNYLPATYLHEVKKINGIKDLKGKRVAKLKRTGLKAPTINVYMSFIVPNSAPVQRAIHHTLFGKDTLYPTLDGTMLPLSDPRTLFHTSIPMAFEPVFKMGTTGGPKQISLGDHFGADMMRKIHHQGNELVPTDFQWNLHGLVGTAAYRMAGISSKRIYDAFEQYLIDVKYMGRGTVPFEKARTYLESHTYEQRDDKLYYHLANFWLFCVDPASVYKFIRDDDKYTEAVKQREKLRMSPRECAIVHSFVHRLWVGFGYPWFMADRVDITNRLYRRAMMMASDIGLSMTPGKPPDEYYIIRKSTIPKAGAGVFTTVLRKTGDELMSYEGTYHNEYWNQKHVALERQSKQHVSPLEYTIELADEKTGKGIGVYINASEARRSSNRRYLAAKINHAGARHANCKFQRSGNRVIVVVTKAIEARAELFVTYGREFWEHRRHVMRSVNGEHTVAIRRGSNRPEKARSKTAPKRRMLYLF